MALRGFDKYQLRMEKQMDTEISPSPRSITLQNTPGPLAEVQKRSVLSLKLLPILLLKSIHQTSLKLLDPILDSPCQSQDLKLTLPSKF